MSCHAYRERADACRETWVKEVQGADVRFFLGRGNSAALADEVHLDVEDDYKSFPLKVQAMRRWALEQKYDYVLKVDDDVYLNPARLMASGFEGHDYRGRLRGPSGNYPAPYCSGFAYWLSRRALETIVDVPWNGDIAEDRFTGNALLEKGIKPSHERRFAVVWSKRNSISFAEPPLQGNSVIAACEYEADMMRQVHAQFPERRSTFEPLGIARGSLNKVAVMIKTFLRDGYLQICLKGLQHSCSDMKVVVVDDGCESVEKIRKYADMLESGHSFQWLPFDSGFGAKANAAIPYLDREYVLIGSDDFDFKDPQARLSIEKMVKVLDADPEMDVASGRVNGNPYEGLLSFKDDHCWETRGYRETREIEGARYHLCDLTVNFSLIRRRVLDSIHWDDDVKIGGGEHGAFFIDLKRAGFKVCYVEGANINELPQNQLQWRDIQYGKMRARASEPGRICLKRRGVNFYHTFGGHIERT